MRAKMIGVMLGGIVVSAIVVYLVTPSPPPKKGLDENEMRQTLEGMAIQRETAARIRADSIMDRIEQSDSGRQGDWARVLIQLRADHERMIRLLCRDTPRDIRCREP